MYWYCFVLTASFELLTWCLVVFFECVWYCLTWLLQLSACKTAVVPGSDCIDGGWIVTNRYLNRQNGSLVKIFLPLYIYIYIWISLKLFRNPKYNSSQSCLCFVNQSWISNRWTMGCRCPTFQRQCWGSILFHSKGALASAARTGERTARWEGRNLQFVARVQRISEIHNCCGLSWKFAEKFI